MPCFWPSAVPQLGTKQAKLLVHVVGRYYRSLGHWNNQYQLHPFIDFPTPEKSQANCTAAPPPPPQQKKTKQGYVLWSGSVHVTAALYLVILQAWHLNIF